MVATPTLTSTWPEANSGQQGPLSASDVQFELKALLRYMHTRTGNKYLLENYLSAYPPLTV